MIRWPWRYLKGTGSQSGCHLNLCGAERELADMTADERAASADAGALTGANR